MESFIWRGCDIAGTGAREAINRINDLADRARALLEEPEGIPPDPRPPANSPHLPTICVSSAEWSAPVDNGLGLLEPGTYSYKLIPFDSCNGGTGEPYVLPDLVITKLGQQATLTVTFCEYPSDCLSAFLTRNGVMVGDPFPVRFPRSRIITRELPVEGQYIHGTANTIEIVPGSPELLPPPSLVEPGDAFELTVTKGFTNGPQTVLVEKVEGNVVTFVPPLAAAPITQPYSFQDLGNRTGLYFSGNILFPVNVPLPPLGFPSIPFIRPYFAFTSIPIPSAFGIAASIVDVTNGFATLEGLSGMKKEFEGGVLAVANASSLFNNGVFVITKFLSPTSVQVAFSFGTADEPNNGQIVWVLSSPATPRPGDIITWNSKTAIVVHVEPDPITSLLGFNGSLFLNVAVLPFGINPIAPMPIGSFQLVHRPSAPISYGVYNVDTNYSASSPAVQGDTVVVEGDPDNQGNPKDSRLKAGIPIIVDGELTAIRAVVPGTAIGGGSDLTKCAIILDPPLLNSNKTSLRVPGNQFIYLSVPIELSPFIDRAAIESSGSYKRVTRTTETTTVFDAFSLIETGQYKFRTGTIPEEAATAFNSLDALIAGNGYAGGLNGLIDRVRGPSLTLTNRSFNDLNGTFVQTRVNGAFFPVNDVADRGGGPVLTLAGIRKLRSLLCNSFRNVASVRRELASAGFAVMRLEKKFRVLPGAACPPGQEPTQITELSCVGLASPGSKLKASELARVFWNGQERNRPGVKNKLLALGLSQEEADAALSLRATGRVLTVLDVFEVMSGIEDLEDVSQDANVDDILDDLRVTTITLTSPSRDHIIHALTKGAQAGKVDRAVGDGIVQDFSPIGVPLLEVALQFSCNEAIDFILSLLPDVARSAVAGVLSVIETAINAIKEIVKYIKLFLEHPLYKAAKEAIAGVVMAVTADPLLACFLGPSATIPGSGINPDNITKPISKVIELISQITGPMSARLNLVGFAASIIESIVCAVMSQLSKLLQIPKSDTRHAVGCLFSSEDLSLLNFPLDVSLTIDCKMDFFNTLTDVLKMVIGEINEAVGFLNSLSQGLLFKTVGARNTACSSDQNWLDAVSAAVVALGLPTSLAQDAAIAAALATEETANAVQAGALDAAGAIS